MPEFTALLPTLLPFLACVVAATVVQNLTGFALGLVLLGLVELLHLVPIAEAANASMALSLVNAIAFFRAERSRPPWRMMRPALLASLPGVVLGVALLAWLSLNATLWLRLLLGLAVLGSAVVLGRQGQARAQPSAPPAFAVAGFLAGLLGGLFSTSGPPIVFHLYRQPFDAATIRRALVLVFSVNALTRMVLVTASGHLSTRSIVLGAVAVPVVMVVTHLCVRYPIPVRGRTLNLLAAGLLAITGSTLTLSAARLLAAAPAAVP
ncbi:MULTISPECIES: TSUP family transporter [Ramlibacter]|uniref:Probable membrane transporter protein n=1 Tax=Ramlibacter aquaticus TaxID=2780094 RepID=A0ABR9SG05_9BURK|nr:MULTISPECIES: TSUP family transporter [Ramlibacter]MBE7941114.1 TSUP family transporter [Ramlibacter aquaticus]